METHGRASLHLPAYGLQPGALTETAWPMVMREWADALVDACDAITILQETHGRASLQDAMRGRY